MSMKRLFVEPLDVLMFRNERPFKAKEANIAKAGVISHLTFEGAIKTKILSEFCATKGYSLKDFQNPNLQNLQQLMQKDQELEEVLKCIGYAPLNFRSGFCVEEVHFVKKDELSEYFPLPNNIVKENSGLSILQPNENFKFEAKSEELWLGVSKNSSKVESTSGLMSKEDLMEYLLNDEAPSDPSLIEPLPYDKEIRTGIKLDKNKKTTEEGALYTAEFIRLKENWGFTVLYRNEPPIMRKYLGESGILTLGGEGKGASYKSIEEVEPILYSYLKEIVKKINKNKRFKLYLAIPSYFAGSLPSLGVIQQIFKLKGLKLVAAFPGKPIYLGGYDIARNKEKPLKRWVNAGAVYYFKFEEGKFILAPPDEEGICVPLRIRNGKILVRKNKELVEVDIKELVEKNKELVEDDIPEAEEYDVRGAYIGAW